MILYRIQYMPDNMHELKLTEGPYNCSLVGFDCIKWLTREHTSVTGHPNLYNDGFFNLVENIEDYFCAFTNLGQLRQWFTDQELRNLWELNFHIVVIRSHNYFCSEKQAIFKKDSAEFLSEISILELLNNQSKVG